MQLTTLLLLPVLAALPSSVLAQTGGKCTRCESCVCSVAPSRMKTVFLWSDLTYVRTVQCEENWMRSSNGWLLESWDTATNRGDKICMCVV